MSTPLRALPARVLTLSRLLGLPLFLWLLLRVGEGAGGGLPTALVLSYLALALSDYFDGPVARRAGTDDPWWGRVDVAADVLFNAASLGVAASLGLVGFWVPAGVVLLGGRFLARIAAAPAGAATEDRAGKLAGVFYYLLVGVIVLELALGVPGSAPVARSGDAVFLFTLYAFWRGRR